MDNISQIFCVLGVVFGTYFLLPKHGEKDLLTEEVSAEYDYVIVGSGSAGSVLAARLSEDTDVTVLLLEAGGFYGEHPDLHTTNWVSYLESDYALRFLTTPQTHSCQGMKGKRGRWHRGRVLGGSSVLNAMQYTRGSPFDFDGWEARGAKGWSYKDVLPYFLKSEDIQIPELKNSKYHSSGGPLVVSSGVVSGMADRILTAAQELGYNVTDYNSATPEGFSHIQLNVKNGVRSSVAKGYLEPIAGRPNLHISINSHVTKVAIDNKSAKGVYFIKNGLKRFVRARKEVIVSAGAIQSPQLLMLSGIGPKDHLTDLGIQVVADLPVGQNLQDHQMVVLSSKINESVSITPQWRESFTARLQYHLLGSGPLSVTGNEVTAFIHTDENQTGRTYPDIWLVFVCYLTNAYKDLLNLDNRTASEFCPHAETDHGFLTAIALTHPESTGTVKLASTDPFEPPEIDSQFFTNPIDIDTMIKGFGFWEKLMQTDTMKQLGVNMEDSRMAFCLHHPFRSNEYWECVVRHIGSTVWHHSGTCKMGDANDHTAVVDPQLRVRGIQRLRVVDSSVFPFVTSGNTNAPTIMVAEKAADMIRCKDTVKVYKRD